MWEVIRRFNLDGNAVKMWRSRDAEGRYIYDVSLASDIHEPTGGLLCPDATISLYQRGEAMNNETL